MKLRISKKMDLRPKTIADVIIYDEQTYWTFVNLPKKHRRAGNKFLAENLLNGLRVNFDDNTNIFFWKAAYPSRIFGTYIPSGFLETEFLGTNELR